VSALQNKVKNALDEVRMLILGLQVLLGFQFRAFFEKGYDQLSALDRGCELVGLFAFLVVLTILFLAPARHRQVEQGNDTARFHLFTMSVMRAALFPFAVGLAADVFVAADRIAGRTAAAVVAACAGGAALGLWYGHFLRTDRLPHEEPEDAVERTKLEHRIVQVLTEARVVLPGAQALLGFQLAMTLIGPAFAADLYVVLERAGFESAAAPLAACALACFYGAWFGAMQILRRARRSEVLLSPSARPPLR
jgi:hypothetical protein